MGTRTRLAAMMFLAYSVQGAWWPLLAIHLDDLKVAPRERGWIFATLAIAAMIAPPIAGRLADRTLSAQKLLAILYALAVAFLIAMAMGVATTTYGLIPLFLAYWLVVIPYLNLTNTIAMRNLTNCGDEFGGIRMWGTVGWMAAGWIVAGVMAFGKWGTPTMFLVAAILAALMFIVCLTLPETPPLATSSRGLPIREALQLLHKPGVGVLLLAGFLVSLTTPFVYQAVPPYLSKHLGMNRPSVASAMTLGQVPEIVALLVLPVVLHRIGRKATLLLGIGSWIVYHGLFASNPNLMLALVAIPLNGLAIAFFHITAPMYLDSQAPSDHRAGVQGLWVMTTSGVGSLIGGLLAGEVMQRAANNWRVIFAVPSMCATIALVLVLLAFRQSVEEKRIVKPSGFDPDWDSAAKPKPACADQSTFRSCESIRGG